MHRRVVFVSLTAALAVIASPVAAQLIKSNVTHDSNVRSASCHSAIGGCAGCDSCSGGVTVLPGVGGCGGDCSGGHLGNFGACGPGGCASGDCSRKCFAAPFGHCLYPIPCYGPCAEVGCKTIFGELAMDVRRWCLGRQSCGGGPLGRGLLSPRIENCTDGVSGGLLGGSLLGRGGFKSCSIAEAMDISCGCESAGCSGDCSMGAAVEVQGDASACESADSWCRPTGGLLGRWMERSCGCENVGCSGDCSTGAAVEVPGNSWAGESADSWCGPTGGLLGRLMERSCGCENVGCSGDCFTGAAVEVQRDSWVGKSADASCGPTGGLLGRWMERSCGCENVGCSGDCSAGTVVAMGGLESSCGCESVGGAGAACFQDVLSPCRGRGLLGSIGGLLFGQSCGCGSCSGSSSNDECSGTETSCGVENAGIDCNLFRGSGCATAIRQPHTRRVSAEEPLRSKLLTKRIITKPIRSAVVTVTKQRGIRFAGDPATSETDNTIERVRYTQESKQTQKQTIRFLSDEN